MKKLVFLVALLLPGLGRAQAPLQLPLNFDFEELNSDSTLSHWGNQYIFNGSDSIIYDQYIYAPSPQAHSGTWAAELRNIRNVTQGSVLAGSISLDVDTVFSQWGTFLVPIATTPTELRFWYHFAPVGGDTAYALLQVFDSVGTELGLARALLTAPTAAYTQAREPIVYHTAGRAAYVLLRFSTFYTSGQLTLRQPTFGTRLLIDDVGLNAPLGLTSSASAGTISLYPNPATDVLRVRGAAAHIELFDTCGRCVRSVTNATTVDLSELTPGLYVARLRTPAGALRTQRVVKN